jgi:hypothetical protein
MSEIRASLCPQCDACPEVVITNDLVTIGEEGNRVSLTHREWNVLVTLVREDTLQRLDIESENIDA